MTNIRLKHASETSSKMQKNYAQNKGILSTTYTRELFDNELWDEIRTYWLEPRSTLPKETVWALVKEVRLESLKAKTITDEHIVSEERFESADMLEILWTAPYQFLEKKLQYKVRYIISES